MTYPTRLGQLTIEEDANILKTLLDVGGTPLVMTDPLETYTLQPFVDCDDDLGIYNKRYNRVWVCQAYIFGEPYGVSDPATYIWNTNGAGYTQLDCRVLEVNSGYATWNVRVTGSSGDYSSLALDSEGGGHLSRFYVKVGAGGPGSLGNYQFGEASANFYANLQLSGGGLSLTPTSVGLYTEDSTLSIYERSGDPAVTNNEGVMWVSDGTATGAAGDLVWASRQSGVTRTFILAPYSAGGGNNSIAEYLYHTGDTDTYLRFQDDQGALAAGGVTFIEWIETTQNIIHFNSADADVDFQVDTTLGAGSLFVEGSSGYVGVNIVTGLSGLLHVNQNASGGAIPALHLEQDDVSEEFIRLTGQSSDGVITQSLVEEPDATPTLVGWFKINVQDEGTEIADGAYFVPFYSLA